MANLCVKIIRKGRPSPPPVLISMRLAEDSGYLERQLNDFVRRGLIWVDSRQVLFVWTPPTGDEA
jgi:hypothetical protein